MRVYRFPAPVIVEAWCENCQDCTDHRILPDHPNFCRCSCGYVTLTPTDIEDLAA